MKIGIYNPYIHTMGGGERVTAAMATYFARQPDDEVGIITSSPVDLKKVGGYFDCDLSRVKVYQLPKMNFLFRVLTSRFCPIPMRVKFLLGTYYDHRAIQRLKLDLFINNFYQSNCPPIAPQSIYMCMFPQRLSLKYRYKGFVRKTYGYLIEAAEKRLGLDPAAAIERYTTITANSKYTAGWIQKYWGRPSVVLYPPCTPMKLAGVKKRPQILHVGRFFPEEETSHNKHQDILIEAFKKLSRLHPDYELHLTGSIDMQDEAAVKHLGKLKQAAEGYPIFFHLNVRYDELKKLYNQSTIYWHATGYGSDPQAAPETQEHFGITTVEAMSAGAIPVVINSAGQQEIIEKDNGILWDTPAIMIEATDRLINDAALQKRLSMAAQKRAEQFTTKAFEQQLKTVIENL